MNEKPKRLLFSSGQMRGNVVFNFRNSPMSEFGHYAEQFHAAGKILVQRMEESRSMYSDLEACPIVTLYRHALELYFKDIVIVGNYFVSASGKTPVVKTEDIGNYSHRLSQFVPAVKQAFDTVGWGWEINVENMKTPIEFQNFVGEFDLIDPFSQAFRYPAKKNGEAILPHHFLFNIIDFSKKLDPVLDMLDTASFGLRNQWQMHAEALYEEQHA